MLAIANHATRRGPRAPQVDSAFNGLGVYRVPALRAALSAGCAYRGTRNSYQCEHVPFHLCMRKLGMAIGILPAATADCGRVLLARPPTRHVTVRADGLVRTVDLMPDANRNKTETELYALWASVRAARRGCV